MVIPFLRFHLRPLARFLAASLLALGTAPRPAQAGPSPAPRWSTTATPWDRALGSHRVILHADRAAPALRASLPWRRRDADPQNKAIIVQSLATGAAVPNVITLSCTPLSGEILFEPSVGPGDYAVYFLPVQITGGAFPVGQYLQPTDQADPAWKARAAAGNPQSASIVAWEALSDHDAWSPAEVIASDEEVAALADQWKGGLALLLPPRGQEARMADHLPCQLVQDTLHQASLSSFQPDHHLLQGRPGEHLVFQVLAWSQDRDFPNLEVKVLAARESPSSWLPADQFTCLNTQRTNWKGESSSLALNLPQRRAQALWFSVDLPSQPGRSTYTLSLQDPSSGLTSLLGFTVAAAGPLLPDHGDADPQSLSRLRWLNSTTAIDDEPAKGYPALHVDETARRIRTLGAEITLTENGLPQQITSFYNKAVTRIGDAPTLALLADPGMAFEIDGAAFGPPTFRWTSRSPAAVAWESVQSSPRGRATLTGSLEFDGSLRLDFALEATGAPWPIEDVRLQVPRTPESTPYLLGLNHETGTAPAAPWEWHWDTAHRHQDSVWLGAAHGGLRVQLKADNYVRPGVNIHYARRPLNDPPSWSAHGLGGIRYAQNTLTCFSGKRLLAPDQTLHFGCDLLITPFHPLRTAEQWADRYYHTNSIPADYSKYLDSAKSAGANVVNIHQGNALNPFINYPFLTWAKLRDFTSAAHQKGLRAKYYYTVRELSNWSPEIYAFRSLGDEILMPGQGGGHPWGEEHLGGNYWQAWFEPSVQDVSFLTQPMSRLHNYYIEGLRWLCENAACDGIYLDDIAYDRSIMLRARKVLDRSRPQGGLIDLHSWNEFHAGGAWAHCPNIFMDSMPFVDRLWFGEGHHYSGPPPEHFLVELSGIPFGLMGEMLEGGGNPWFGLVHGMTGRLGWQGDPRPLWRLWDDFGVADSEFIGWWAGSDSPIHPSSPDVKASLWKKGDATLVALANFRDAPQSTTLAIDWKALGLDPAQAKLFAIPIPELKQRPALLDPAAPINLRTHAGAVFILDAKDHPLDAPSAPSALGEILFDEDFSAPDLDPLWKLQASPSARSGARRDAGYVLQSPANLHAFLERPLLPDTGSVSARLWQDGKDAAQQWGPGLALVWPNGKTLRASLRQDGRLAVAPNGREDFPAAITARAPVELTLLWDDRSLRVLAGGPAMGDLTEEIARFPRQDFPGPPASLRVGKMPSDASPSDHADPGPVGFNRIERVQQRRAAPGQP